MVRAGAEGMGNGARGWSLVLLDIMERLLTASQSIIKPKARSSMPSMVKTMIRTSGILSDMRGESTMSYRG